MTKTSSHSISLLDANQDHRVSPFETTTGANSPISSKMINTSSSKSLALSTQTAIKTATTTTTTCPKLSQLPTNNRKLPILVSCFSLILIASITSPQFVQDVQANLRQTNGLMGVQQSMAQMLQVFNGNDSQQLEANHFKIVEVVHNEWLLLGGRNVVYNLSLSSMREQRRLEWPSSDEDVRMCQVKGKSREQCQNYIRVIKMQAPETLLVCGTNAYKPRCRSYQVTPTGYELLSEEPGEGACPYQENQNVTSTLADGQLYSATAAQFSGIDGLIHRRPLRTEQFNPKQLNSPNFVSSFKYRDHVYFLFREIAIEHINCGKTIYSRIARVCVNDSGGQTRSNRERWTSFAKARLNCSIPGEFPFYFDEIQASTHVLASSQALASPLSSGFLQGAAGSASGRQQQQTGAPIGAGQQPSNSQDLIYAVFTTPQNSIGGSAICAYRMRDIESAFEGPFKGQADSNSMWLPVAESRIPNPRPGSCSNDSKRLPDETINFLKDHPLMDTTIEPIWSQPLITMASINFRFTQIAVDVQVAPQAVVGAPSLRTDVIFVSTDDGRAFKLINTFHLYGQQAYQQQQQQQQQLLGTNYAPLAQPYTFMANANHHNHHHQPQQRANQQQMHYPPPAGAYRATQAGPMLPVAAPQIMGGPAGAAIGRSEPIADVSASTLVIEELHLFDSRTPIVGLLISYPSLNQQQQQHPSGKLIVVSSRQVKAIPLSRCERAQSCADCLALFDPYCSWDLKQQACLSSGRSQLAEAGLETHWFGASQQPSTSWFPPNSLPLPIQAPNNHSLAWWLTCPAPNQDNLGQQQQLVGAPYRSLFSSHLQVPSRFDYQSGHHLAHTSLIAASPSGALQHLAGQARAVPSSAPASQLPASECLTYCGGVYVAPASPSGPEPATGAGAGAGANALGQQPQQLLLGQCADLMLAQQQQHHSGFLQSPAFNPTVMGPGSNTVATSGPQAASFYSSENLYLAVIIGSALGLALGLLFGFAMGKSSRKHDPSICSSTFDETNLYMASTGSHHGAGHLFGQQQARLHPLLQSNGSGPGAAGYLAAMGHQQRSNGAAAGQAAGGSFEASQCLLSDSLSPSIYGNQVQQQQQQMLLGLATGPGPNGAATTGRSLPPIPGGQLQQPQQQQPLVNNSPGQTQTTTIATTTNSNLLRSQLTPNSSTASQSGSSGSTINTSSTSATMQLSNEQQLYLNQQQMMMQQQQQQPLAKLGSNNKSLHHAADSYHQRTFTDGSINSNGSNNNKLSAGKLISSAQTNQQQQQSMQNNSSSFQAQLQAAQQQLNNKIYL